MWSYYPSLLDQRTSDGTCLFKLLSRAVSERASQTLGRGVGVALVRLRLKLWTPNLFSVLGCQVKPFQDAFFQLFVDKVGSVQMLRKER